MPTSPSTSTTEDSESRVAVVLRDYNVCQSALSLQINVTVSVADVSSGPQLSPVL